MALAESIREIGKVLAVLCGIGASYVGTSYDIDTLKEKIVLLEKHIEFLNGLILNREKGKP